ncbi:hypothetical protein ACN2MM_09500 [Alkalilimnicola ehrlichii MLHE-1]|uniref:Uncharacterized protein n=1 Tax=Alkalilimnicola ehrlichii (strain ATCC BAA-1101 / DSM 17681 / MLHE-1) TaxID=187272 RepID=Q0A7U0_ALKEH|nr:hypothetical protein [Alkalilimnicola ehrlichii]ABI57097.1 conserved hypothetical protein [Alkalilimnicola ehrlichii MLHE-1]
MGRHVRGVLVEYAQSASPLTLVFEFNPETLSRSRSVEITLADTPATRGGYDFQSPSETPRVSQGVSVEPEGFDVEILLDATDRMGQGDPVASASGVEPELDTLRSMVEPKVQGPDGMQTLASLGMGGQRAFQRDESASVLLFLWGSHVLPVFLKGIDVQETAHLPSLVPYRATVTLSLQVIEGNNPFYREEKIRQAASAALHSATAPGHLSGGMS